MMPNYGTVSNHPMMPDIQVYYLQHLYLENSPANAPGIDAIT